MLRILASLVRVMLAVLLVAAGVVSAALGCYFALNHNAHVFDGATLLLVAGVTFAVACFAAARKLIRMAEPDPATT
jgi:hypothetical protein